MWSVACALRANGDVSCVRSDGASIPIVPGPYVFIDAGRITDAVSDRLRQEVLNAYPRPAGDRSIADAIVAHATRSEAAAPPGSLAFELLRQHREAERARVRRQEST